MCTVTFIPLGNNDFILTSNRDEQSKRKTIAPKSYQEDGVTMVFPKDALAGGTWIGTSDKKRLICLLNGAYQKHQKKATYRKSRGLIVKELLKEKNGFEALELIDLLDIEPFTLIMIEWETSLIAKELIWDGKNKNISKIAITPRIWSSATLYTPEMKETRKKWFDEWLQENKVMNKTAIIAFHQDKTKGASEFSIQMKRSYIQTISTTCVEKTGDNVFMEYFTVSENAY